MDTFLLLCSIIKWLKHVEGGGHILIRGKENNGNPFLLDLQTSKLIRGKDKIIQHFLNKKKI